MRQLHIEQRRLQRIEPAVDADEFVIVARLHAVAAEQPELVGQGIVVGREHARVAVSAEVFWSGSS